MEMASSCHQLSSAMAQQLLKPRGFAARSLASRRRVYHSRFFSNSTHAASGASSASYDAASSTLAPSQLSRYLLGRDLDNQGSSTATQCREDAEFLLRFQNTQSINTRRLRHPDGSLLSIQPPTDLHNVSNLHDLQLWLEKHAASGFVTPLHRDFLRIALHNCERDHSSQEILSTLNAFARRCNKSGVTAPDIIHIEGLRCASQIILPSALLYHVTKLSGPVQGDDAGIIIKCLLKTLQTLRFNNLKYDTEVLLAVVAGEGPQEQHYPVALFENLVLDDESYSTAIELLQLLGAPQRLKKISTSLLKRLSKSPSPDILNDTYSCLSALLQAGEVAHTEVCLKPLLQIMKNVSNVHASPSVSSRLLTDLKTHGLADNWDVESLLRAAEGQSPDGTDGDAGMQSIQMDGETIDFSSVESLMLQINQYGNSLSTSEIGIVIDALSDLEGFSIPLFLESLESGIREFAWLPKWIPVARQSEDLSDSSSAIGLLRARVAFSADTTLVTPERSRNLFQLGYLVQRELLLPDDTISTGEAYAENWVQTGYLVAFDRLSSEFVLLFVGEDPTLFGSDHLSPADESVTEMLQQHPLIGSLSTLSMPGSPQDFDRDIEHVAFPVENAGSRYIFDIDPRHLTY